MKILITGANGLISQKIIRHELAAGDFEVIATSKSLPREEIIRDRLHYERFDITDELRGKEIFEKYKPEFVLNAAAITQADDCEINTSLCRKVNTDAVRSLLELCRKYNSFFIQLSTDFVFNGAEGPYGEDDIPIPVSKYGTSKYEAEKIVGQSGIEWAIIRTILVYGHSAFLIRKNLVIWVIDSLNAGEKIKVVSDQVRTPTLAEDVASGCAMIIRKKQKGIFHIGGKDTLSPFQMALETAKHFGLDESLVEEVITGDFPQPAKRPMRTGLLIDKARKLLGYEPHSFREGLEIIKQQISGTQRQ